MNSKFRTVLRVLFLIIISAIFYKRDIHSFISFFCLMIGIFWVIPEVCIFIYNQMKGDDEDD